MLTKFLKALSEYLKLQLLDDDNIPLKIGVLSEQEKGMSIVLRPIAAGQSYYNKNIKNVSLQILFKDKDQLKAIETLEKVSDLILQFKKEDLLSIESYTEINFVELTDNNKYIYTALFKAELLESKGE